ncbi:MAG: hypothetical protein ACPG8W_04290 [Candidatus Promineifilaceae bacterium]
MSTESFEQMLSGGYHNSLGRTLDVVDLVLADPDRLEALYNCYFSEDEVVRLRTSNAIKRVTKAHPDWTVPYIDRLIETVSKIDQPSTHWTMANLFELLETRMTDKQKADAKVIMKHNLTTHRDWIVLTCSIKTLSDWAVNDAELREWLLPELERHAKDKRKSVSKRATQQLARLN